MNKNQRNSDNASCFIVDGVTYTVTNVKRAGKKRAQNSEIRFNNKLADNLAKQKDELRALSLIHKENFVKERENKFTIHFLLRGLPDASFSFSYPPQYPSDVPPTYSFEAPWLSEDKRKELYGILRNIYTDKFGECIVYAWADEITTFLKEQRRHVEEEPVIEVHELATAPEPVVDNCPEIHEGKTISDRNSYFTPYLAAVKSEKDVKMVIEKIEDCRKVATAFRNTYAYRFMSGTKQIELGEDGGEPKAGRNLLQRLISYNANNLIVYISRRIGGSLLGPDRYKHLNNAADSVLISQGYKPIAEEGTKKKKEKKYNKKQHK